jgi:stage II sporulation protein GA (sporulation sigma-E factor processing peptidase)
MVNGVSTLFYSLEMDWVLLWLTAKLLGHRTTRLRLTIAAIIGVLPTLWVLLRENLYAVPWELGLVWPAFMLGAAFWGLPRRYWIKTWILFVVMSLLAGGMMSAGLNWLAMWAPRIPGLDWGYVVPPVLIAGGWWMPKRRVRQIIGRESHGEIVLELNQQRVSLPVLWDSGNQLTDPVLHRPVVIVELAQVFDWLPEDILPWILEAHRKSSPGPVPEAWQGKAGITAFRTISGEGRLPVLAIDRARGRYLDAWYAMTPLMVGITAGSIAADGSYAALATPKSLLHYPHERVGA